MFWYLRNIDNFNCSFSFILCPFKWFQLKKQNLNLISNYIKPPVLVTISLFTFFFKITYWLIFISYLFLSNYWTYNHINLCVRKTKPDNYLCWFKLKKYIKTLIPQVVGIVFDLLYQASAPSQNWNKLCCSDAVFLAVKGTVSTKSNGGVWIWKG